MRKLTVILVGICFAGFAQLALGQMGSAGSAQMTHQHGVPGYLDPKTGTFTTRAHSSGVSADISPDIATTTILARLVFKFNIRTDQTSPAVTFCTVDLDGGDEAGFYEEEGSAVATAAGTACTVTILFSWTLATPTMDTISVSYDVGAFQPVAVGGISTSEEFRHSSHSIANIAVPLNGQTVNVPAISVTI